MSAASPWYLLPPDLIEHQISQIDLLMAMYPTQDELTIDNDSKNLLDLLREAVENETTAGQPSKPVSTIITLLLNLVISGSDQNPLQLDITVPFSYNEETPPEEPPNIKVRMRQTPWMNRTTATTINTQIGATQDLFSAIESINEAASQHILPTTVPEGLKQDSTAPSINTPTTDPLVRVWFYFPSISTRSKRHDLIIHAPTYFLTGFLYAGKPGLLCVEGTSQNIDDYMKFIKTESWGDIPAHHKKVSERYREAGVERTFDDMAEITDEVGERRGQRVNRGDMRAVEGWLVERGLGEGLKRVLM